MGNTKIDYLNYQISIIVGCSHGCSYCWARNRYAPRLAHNCKLCGKFVPHFHEERLKQIDRIKKTSIVGLNFMGDTWDPNVKQEWRDKIFDKMTVFEGNHYIILTKQPQNIKEKDFGNFLYRHPEYIWVGVSIESMDHMDRWIALSQKEYIKHKIISFEPVLAQEERNNPKSLEQYFQVYSCPDWIIIGALTKSNKEQESLSRYNAELLLSYLLRIQNRPPIFVKDNCGMKNAPKEFPKKMTNA